jgi:hypothetical protein
MADSVRLDVYQAVMTRLATITTGNGYNLSPKICLTQPAAETSTDKVSLFVTFGDEQFEPLGATGGGVACAFYISVHGYIRQLKDSDRITVTEQAIQDVRNCMMANYTGWRSAGATLVSPDVCETDEGILAYDGLAFFTQPFLFTYNGGPTW